MSTTNIFGQQHYDVVLNERQRTMLDLYLDSYYGKLIIKKYARLSEVAPNSALRDIRDLVSRIMLRPHEGTQRNVEFEIKLVLIHKQ